MQHLFESWQSFSSDVIAATRVLLLSDYDGTLTPIVSRPEDAMLSPGVREKLRALAENPAFSVGIISGRLLKEVRQLVGVEGIYYAGNHGLEIEGPGLSFIHPAAESAWMEIADLNRQLSERLSSIEGAFVEDKGLSLSVHYRLVNENDVDTVADIFRQITEPRLKEGKIRLSSGKKVFEVRPPIDWHKGKAVETVIKEIERTSRSEIGTVIYLGDDITDEDAFRVVRHPRGWSVFIGEENQSSSADYFLNSTSEVETLLSRLLELK
ncbi:trehalose-phosphatase [Chloroflexota bacterium]